MDSNEFDFFFKMEHTVTSRIWMQNEILRHIYDRLFSFFLIKFVLFWLQSLQTVLIWGPGFFLLEFTPCINKNAEVGANFESVKTMANSSQKKCLTENKVLKVKNSDFPSLFIDIFFDMNFFLNFDQVIRNQHQILRFLKTKFFIWHKTLLKLKNSIYSLLRIFNPEGILLS